MDFASWSICAGAAMVSALQSSRSGLPLESAWVNCSMALSATSDPLPPARSMSFSPSPALVASPRLMPMDLPAV